MGMRDVTPEPLEENPPWLVMKGTDKNKIENYYGYTQALWDRGDFTAAWDLPGTHAKNKDPKYMTKQDAIDYAKQYYFVDLDPEMTIHKLRGEVRKLRLNPPPPKPDDYDEEPEEEGQEPTVEGDQARMDRLWADGFRPSGDYEGSKPEEGTDPMIAESMDEGSGDS